MRVAAEPRARAARVDGPCLVVDLEPATAPLWADQLFLSVSSVPALAAASAAQLRRVEVIDGGRGLRWPLIDADLTVRGLLRGLTGGGSTAPRPPAPPA